MPVYSINNILFGLWKANNSKTHCKQVWGTFPENYSSIEQEQTELEEVNTITALFCSQHVISWYCFTPGILRFCAPNLLSDYGTAVPKGTGHATCGTLRTTKSRRKEAVRNVIFPITRILHFCAYSQKMLSANNISHLTFCAFAINTCYKLCYQLLTYILYFCA